jgi:hypothetical protein
VLLADNHVKVADESWWDEGDYVQSGGNVLKVHIRVLKCAFTTRFATVLSHVRVATPVTTHT